MSSPNRKKKCNPRSPKATNPDYRCNEHTGRWNLKRTNGTPRPRTQTRARARQPRQQRSPSSPCNPTSSKANDLKYKCNNQTKRWVLIKKTEDMYIHDMKKKHDKDPDLTLTVNSYIRIIKKMYGIRQHFVNMPQNSVLNNLVHAFIHMYRYSYKLLQKAVNKARAQHRTFIQPSDIPVDDEPLEHIRIKTLRSDLLEIVHKILLRIGDSENGHFIDIRNDAIDKFELLFKNKLYNRDLAYFSTLRPRYPDPFTIMIDISDNEYAVT